MRYPARLRPILGLVGALAGFAYFALIEDHILEGAPTVIQRFVTYFAIAVFPAFGLMAGPVKVSRAGILAVALAAVTALLVTWAGTRFAQDPARLFGVLEPTDNGMIVAPFLALTALSLPCLTAAGQSRNGWRDAARVMPIAWAFVLKGLISLLFLGLFWIVYFLSHQLLSLAGLDILEDLIDWDPGAYLLSGALIGLALAVTCELDGLVSTAVTLVLRLLRLLLVPVAGVLTLFVLATLAQGLDDVFNSSSAAATMMGMAAGAIVLIAASLSLEDDTVHTPRAVAWSARVMGVVLPVVAGIAAYAIWLRVGDYGWTPPRLLASIIAVVVVLFVAPLSWHAVMARAGWPGRILGGFNWALLGTLVLGVLWFTPILNAQRIAAASQLDRLVSGEIDVTRYDFWPLTRGWGTSGTEAIATYRATDPPEHAELRISAAENANRRWQAIRHQNGESDAALWQALNDNVFRVPEDEPLPDIDQFGKDVLSGLYLSRFVNLCGDRETLERCVAVRGNFLTTVPQEEWLLIAQLRPGDWVEMRLLHQAFEGSDWVTVDMQHSPQLEPNHDVIEAIRTGAYDWVPAQIQGLEIGPVRLMPEREDGR